MGGEHSANFGAKVKPPLCDHTNMRPCKSPTFDDDSACEVDMKWSNISNKEYNIGLGFGASAAHTASSSPSDFSKTDNYPEAIAIVGIACRFAQANDAGKLWELISSGRRSHSEIPERSWQSQAWYHPSRDRAGQICTKSGHFLDNVSAFDAPFFCLSAKEAAAMDPMQRLGLEVAYEAFENAGMPAQNLAKSATGVYSGVMTNDYQMLAEGDPLRLGFNSAAGTGKSMLSNRISWFFDLRGPSLTIDTACASSLYAMHLACQSLRTGETRQALVTGHNLILHPTLFSQLSTMHMVSPDGVSKSFDASADGYGRGEGIAAVVVKTLAAAIADGDVIRAVIRATGTGSDGKTPGITVPNGDAQADLIRKVYAAASLDMAQTGYFEAHGTGTSVGDPIEVQAISKTIGAARKARGLGPLFVGSIKPNIGHTEGCAGLAGLIKAVLCLEAGVIPPVAGLVELSPTLKESREAGNLEFPMGQCRPWPTKGLRRVSVNSFGFGGANAHAVIDDACYFLDKVGIQRARHITRRLGNRQDVERSQNNLASSEDSKDHDQDPLLFVTSSFDRKGLERNAKNLASFIKHHNSGNLQSLSYILACKRTTHSFRSFAVAKTKDELVQKLLPDHKENSSGSKQNEKEQSQQQQQQQQTRRLPEFQSPHTRRPVVFLFTGQGAQRPGMAAELMRSNRFPAFTASIACSQAFLKSLGCEWDLVELLTSHDTDANLISDPQRSQPACTAVQIALVHLLADWGVVPSAVIGHSSGEIVAAHAAGAVSHQDAIKVAYHRGLLSAQVVIRHKGRTGSMLAAGLSETEARMFLGAHNLEQDITIACINSPQSVTLSGEASAIARTQQALQEAGYFTRELRTGGVAYHSPYMNTVGADFIKSLGSFSPSIDGRAKGHAAVVMNVPMYSTVTEGPILDAAVLSSADYWHLNMTSPVRFAGALHNLVLRKEVGADGSSTNELLHSTILEIGPSKTLAGPVSQIMADIATTFTAKSSLSPSTASPPSYVPYLSMLCAGQDSRTSVLSAAGTLWAVGHSLDLSRVNGLGPLEVKNLSLKESPILPPYAWDHSKTYWHDTCGLRGLGKPRHDLIGVPTCPRNPFEPSWNNVLRRRELPWLSDHRVDGITLFPAAGYLAMAIEAVRALLADERGSRLCGVELTDVQFEKGLVIGGSRSSSNNGDQWEDNDDGQDIMLSLGAEKDEDTSFNFSVYAASEDDGADGWRRLARGTVQGLVDDGDDHDDDVHDDGLQSSSFFERAARKAEWVCNKRPQLQRIAATAPHHQSLDVAAFYSNLAAIGLEYGPTFRGLREIRCQSYNRAESVQHGERDVGDSGGSAFGEVLVPDTHSGMPHGYEHEYLIHPATLDGLFQLVFAALQAQPHHHHHSGGLEQAAIPVSIRRIFVGSSTPRAPGSRLVGVATAWEDQGKAESSGVDTSNNPLLATGPEATATPVTTITGNLTFATQALEAPSVIVEDIVLRQLPRSSTLLRSELNSRAAPVAAQPLDSFQRTAKIVWKEDIDQSFARWRQHSLLPDQRSMSRQCSELFDLFTHKHAHASVLFVGASSLCMSLAQGHHLARFATWACIGCSSETWRQQLGRAQKPQGGKFELLVYQASGTVWTDTGLHQLAAVVKETCVPNAMVLLLDPDNQAVKKFDSWQPPKLDMGESFSKALRVLHLSSRTHPIIVGTSEVDVTELLSLSAAEDGPGNTVGGLEKVYLIGRNDNQKSCTQRRSDSSEFAAIIAGLLPVHLSKNGLDCMYLSLTEAAANASKLKGETLVSLLEIQAPLVHSWSTVELDACRKIIGSGASSMLWVATADLVSSLTETSLEYSPTVGFLRTMRAEHPSIFLPYLDLGVKTFSQQPELAAEIVVEILKLSAMNKSGAAAKKQVETEFAEMDGRLLIPRIMASNESDMYLATENPVAQQQPPPAVHLHPAIKGPWGSLKLDQNGEPNGDQNPHLWLRDFGHGGKDVRWVLQPVQDAAAKPPFAKVKITHALVRGKAWFRDGKSLNHALITAEQLIGVVESVADSAASSSSSDSQSTSISAGDVVLVTTSAAVRPHLSVYDQGSLLRLPNQQATSKSLAAAVFWLGPMAVAFYILMEMAKISATTREPSVLIDVGENALLLHTLTQAAKALGAGKIFVVVEDENGPSNRQCVTTSTMNMDDRIVMVPRINRQTARLLRGITRGLEVIVSSKLRNTPGRLERLADILSDKGHMVNLDTATVARPPPLRHFNLHNACLGDLCWSVDEHRKGLDKALETVIGCLESGQIHLPDPLGETISASSTCRLTELYKGSPSQNQTGLSTAVLEFAPSDQVTIYRQLRSQPHTSSAAAAAAALDPNGTYIISGGLGAIGLRLAGMLQDMGARHLVLLSRSGMGRCTSSLSLEAAAAAVAELQARSSECRLDIVACDITSEDQVAELGSRLKQSGSRVRGIIQSAMVLSDTTFANMSHAQWEAATAPKIRGSWNLHKLAVAASEDLEFFILLSSVSGVIGNTAQANYCAGNTFEDSLAHHRRARGLPATSLNIGLVSDSSHYGRGTMAAFKSVHEYLAMFGHLSPVVVTMAETLASIKMVIDHRASQQVLPAQLIVGLSSQVPRSGPLLSNWTLDPKFNHRAAPSWLDTQPVSSARGDSTHAANRRQSGRMSEMLASAKNSDQARLLIQKSLKASVAQAMGIEVDSIDEEKSLAAYGIDSLKATSIRNVVIKDFESELSMFELLAPTPLWKLSWAILTKSKLVKPSDKRF